MDTEPTILSLDMTGTIFAIRDHKGRIIGTGTREVCELLVNIINDQPSRPAPGELRTTLPRTNVRAAIVI